MRRRFAVPLAAVLCFGLVSTGRGRNVSDNVSRLPGLHISTNASDRPLAYPGPRRFSSASSVLDTFVLGTFSFDGGGGGSTDGWIGLDVTGQIDTFYHIAGAGELDGGTFGNLIPLEGSKSLWVGASGANHPDVCRWGSAPGTGNQWDQRFTSRKFPRVGEVTLEYMIWWDSEPFYDRTWVQYTNQNDEWVSIFINPPFDDFYDEQGFARESWVIPDTALGDSVQFRFRFTSDGAWNDDDGLWPTDGGSTVDSIVISSAAGLMDFEDFEDEAAGAMATADGDWRSGVPPTYGDMSGLFPALSMLQEDPCVTNLSWVWAFISGSDADYSCGGHPEQTAVAFGKPVVGSFSGTLYLRNEIWSPPIPWTQDVGGTAIPASVASARLEFDVYRDMPIDNLVFGFWSVRAITAGCPGEWRNHHLFFLGDQKDWFGESFEFGDLVPPGTEQVQVSLAIWDTCGFWCGSIGTGACHSHSPMYDNVRVVRIDAHGPLWGAPKEFVARSQDLFQDNFATDGTKTGTVRIDAAKNINSPSNPAIMPGDSACVFVSQPAVGLDSNIPGDPGSGPAVYCHLKDVSTPKSGPAISGDATRWPVISMAGGWTVLQCDVSATSSGNVIKDQYCVDLNDNLYTPGDTIFYYFSARDAGGDVNYWGPLSGVVQTEAEARALAMEMTCLPANALSGATDILYIDDFDNRGAEPFFMSAFEILGLKPDRYDVMAAASMVGNGLGSRVVDVLAQLGCYRKIIWNSGDLGAGLIGDGTGSPAKSDDFSTLLTFLDLHPNRPGLYLSGDNIAAEWVTLTGAGAGGLKSTYMNFNVVTSDHVGIGQPISPRMIGAAGSCFAGAGGPDTLIAYGGCPGISDFDVLQPLGSATVEMAYADDPGAGAVLSQVTQNAVGDTARVMLSGFSYHAIRDDRVQSPIDRVEHLLNILRWLENDVPDPTAIGTPPRFRDDLAQNYPNPFNPSTRIRYSIGARGHVSLRIYSVAGQLVRTLVNGVQTPRENGFVLEWNGTNEAGAQVSSGVYFYKLVAPQFEKTRKMVLLR